MSTPMVRVSGNALRRQFTLKELNEKDVAVSMGKSPNYFVSALAKSKLVDGASLLPLSVTKLIENLYHIKPESYLLADQTNKNDGSATPQSVQIDYTALSNAIKVGIVEACKELDIKGMIRDGLTEALTTDSKRGEECHG